MVIALRDPLALQYTAMPTTIQAFHSQFERLQSRNTFTNYSKDLRIAKIKFWIRWRVNDSNIVCFSLFSPEKIHVDVSVEFDARDLQNCLEEKSLLGWVNVYSEFRMRRQAIGTEQNRGYGCAQSSRRVLYTETWKLAKWEKVMR